ncbi:aminoglycoside phosphotransferase family protein [Cellulomonas sp. URHD0024]|uniref:aminoglycoside phosphotransferase family protein n=1 Tax=Cellulomonas sp. URHD0024 TaxID=1302620 RepID=UPI000408BF8D|nr:aminoglycoside phosphotransferase family protein [Cellulomonas sp. URHD0024]
MIVHPVPEIDVSETLVRALLGAQHPDLAELPLRWAGTGWDNALWRVGDDLAGRFPVRAIAAPLVANEQAWLPVLAPLLPVDVPVPVRVGVPSSTYPWSWSLVPWFDAVAAHHTPVVDRSAWAVQLAEVFVALHRPAPPDAPVNPFRGIPVPRGRFSERLEILDLPDADGILARFRDLADAPAWDGPPLWLHGDPHPANLLVREGVLRAVIDFGDVTSGDPACDLATAWLTFDAEGRAAFRDRLGPDEATWRRAQAWALHMSLSLQAYPDEHPTLVDIGRHGMVQALAE